MYKMILLFLILQLNCTYNYYEEMGCDYDYKIAENENIKTFEDCFNWTKENVYYKEDSVPYAQTPEETYNLHPRSGDCEDLCLMTAYWLYNKLGINSELVYLQIIGTDVYHMILKVENNYYEFNDYNNVNYKINTEYKVIIYIKYCEAVWETQQCNCLYGY